MIESSVYSVHPSTRLDYEEHNRMRLALREILAVTQGHDTSGLFYLGNAFITSPPLPIWANYSLKTEYMSRDTGDAS